MCVVVVGVFITLCVCNVCVRASNEDYMCGISCGITRGISYGISRDISCVGVPPRLQRGLHVRYRRQQVPQQRNAQKGHMAKETYHMAKETYHRRVCMHTDMYTYRQTCIHTYVTAAASI